MTIEEAQKIAQEYLKQTHTYEFVIDNTMTIERSDFWVFYWNSPEYVKTKDIKFANIGASSVFVDKETGDIHQYGTYQSIEYFIKEHERWLVSKQKKRARQLRRQEIFKLITHPWLIFFRR